MGLLFYIYIKFNVILSDGRVKIWRRPNEAFKTQNLCPRVKHGGGSGLVWGCMSAASVENLVFINENMDQHVYLSILKNNLDESANKLGLTGSFIFQQDIDPKHSAKHIKEWLIFKIANQLHTPAQSPDLNPIEHLWVKLGRRIRTHDVRNRQQLQ